MRYLQHTNELKYKELIDRFPKKSDLASEVHVCVSEIERKLGQGIIVVEGNPTEPTPAENKNVECKEDLPKQKINELDKPTPVYSPHNKIPIPPHTNPSEECLQVKNPPVNTWKDMEIWSRDCVITSEDEASTAMRIAKNLTTGVIKYRLERIPLELRERVEKALLDGKDDDVDKIVDQYIKRKHAGEPLESRNDFQNQRGHFSKSSAGKDTNGGECDRSVNKQSFEENNPSRMDYQMRERPPLLPGNPGDFSDARRQGDGELWKPTQGFHNLYIPF